MTNAWPVLGAVFLVRLTLGFQFQTAGTAIPYLIVEYTISYTIAGALVGFYMLPGLLLAVPSCAIGRYFDEKTCVLAGLLLMMVGGLLATGSGSEMELAIARLISGAGATPIFIAMTKMVIDRFDDGTLFVAVGVFILGWPAGIALAQIVQPLIAEAYSWRAVFLSSVVACALALLPFASIRRTHVGDAPPTSAASSCATLTSRELWHINIAGLIWMCLNAAYIIVASFGQLLLLQKGYGTASAGVVASLVSWCFAVAVPLGALVAHRFRTPTVVMAAGLAAAALVAGLMPFAQPPFLAFALFGISLGVATPIVASLPARLLRRDIRSIGLGTYFTWMFAGTAVSPVIAGYATDTSRLAAPFMILAATLLIFCLFGLLVLRGSATWVFSVHRNEPVENSPIRHFDPPHGKNT